MRSSLQSRSGLIVKKRRIVQREHSMIHPRGKLEIPTVSKRSHPQCGQTMLFPPARYFWGPIASFAARMPLLTAVVNLLIKYFFRCTAHNARPEWRGAERANMQTGAAIPRPLQAD